MSAVGIIELQEMKEHWDSSFLCSYITLNIKFHFIDINQKEFWEFVQCPHSEEEDSVATICGFGDDFHDLRVQTH